MKDRRFWACWIFLGLLLPVLLAAQGQRPAPPPSAPPPPPAQGAGGRSGVTLEGKDVAVPVTISPSGPMFGLTPLVDLLGGQVTSDESGESITLRIADKDVVIGPGNAIVTVGDNIVSLSQPPSRGEGGLQVPVDFLRKTYGDLLGYSFEWHPETSRLVIARRGSRELGVTLDVVHLQGMTTVVLQFPDEPHYRIDPVQAGLIKVEMLSDRLTPPAPKEVQDPLVQSVTIDPQQVRIQLNPGAQAESYVLTRPFRLVFDVHPTAAVEVATQPAERSGRQAPGIHTIVIDPGHGAVETGAIGPGGVQEKALTLEFARDLAGKLGRLGVQTILTRSGDDLVALDQRAAIANQNKADLFISIHLNSSLGAGANGTETYFLSPQASDPRAARSAAAENIAPGAPGTGAAAAGATGTGAPAGTAAEQQDVDLILWDLAQSRHLAESQRFATMIQTQLNEALQIKDRGVKQAPFRVLKGATMPAVLVELGFINNPEEEKKLQDPAYRDQILDALVTAIARYRASIEPAAAGAPAPASPPAPPKATAPPAPATKGAPPASKPPSRRSRPA
ncbi:MAG TPA: N-acetylmuramoyl-L-alanine amidase [Thermoanaerobaculia bacterium]